MSMHPVEGGGVSEPACDGLECPLPSAAESSTGTRWVCPLCGKRYRRTRPLPPRPPRLDYASEGMWVKDDWIPDWLWDHDAILHFGWALRDGQWLFAACILFRTEWTERPAAWPHCCTQAGCWMHIGKAARLCHCRCFWCRLARVMQ